MKKKILVFLAIICMSLSLASCNFGFNNSGLPIDIIENEDTEYVSLQNQITKTVKEVHNKVVAIVASNKGSNEASLGSGVIYKMIDVDTNENVTEDTIKAKCYVVSNAHVVNGYSEFNVYLGNNYYRKATLIGMDSANDLSVLTFEVNIKDHPVSSVDLFESDKMDIPALGSYCIAIGTPLSLDNFNYVTLGVVSGVTTKEIKHSAEINPGNSGGALFNTSGRLIGINVSKGTAIIDKENGEIVDIVPIDGMGKAIPIWTVESSIKAIESVNGNVNRPSLGIQAMEVNKTLYPDHDVYLPNTVYAGLMVTKVMPSSPAANAVEIESKEVGLKSNDIIYKVGETPVDDMIDLEGALSIYKAKDKFKMKVYRKVDGLWYDLTFEVQF